MSISNIISIPKNLKLFYNIPDRNSDIPIKIGIFETDGQYIYKQDCIDFINNYGIKGAPANFDYVIDNNIKFVGNDSVNEKALQVWNKGENKAGGEASLDIQIILGVCEIGLNKGDEIYIYNYQWTADGWSPFFQYLNSNTKSDIPRIWSISYGGDEISDGVPSSLIDTVNTLSKNDYQIFIASGDAGSSGCRNNKYSGDIRPSDPAVYPNITAVGGTNMISIPAFTGEGEYVIESPSVASLNSSIPCTENALITSGGGMDGVYTNIFNNPQPVTPYFTDIKGEPILNLQKNIVKEYITELESEKASYTKMELVENIKNFNKLKGFYPRAYPDISGSAEYYTIVLNSTVNKGVAGTSASTPLNASMYAIIMSNLGNNNHGKFNEYIYKAYNSGHMNVFNPVVSGCSETDSNKNATFHGCNSGSLQYGWGVSKNRLSTNSSATGYGFDCVVGLGSINATELQNYISSSITPTKPGISSINIKGNQLQIKYVEADVEEEVEADVEAINTINYDNFYCKNIKGKPAYMTKDYDCKPCPLNYVCDGGHNPKKCKDDEYIETIKCDGFVSSKCTSCLSPKGYGAYLNSYICDGVIKTSCNISKGDRYYVVDNKCISCCKGYNTEFIFKGEKFPNECVLTKADQEAAISNIEVSFCTTSQLF